MYYNKKWQRNCVHSELTCYFSLLFLSHIYIFLFIHLFIFLLFYCNTLYFPRQFVALFLFRSYSIPSIFHLHSQLRIFSIPLFFRTPLACQHMLLRTFKLTRHKNANKSFVQLRFNVFRQRFWFDGKVCTVVRCNPIYFFHFPDVFGKMQGTRNFLYT